MSLGGGWFQDNSTNNENWFFGMVTSHPDDCELMQFTGLKDSKGVEIYEGDIIQSTWRPQDRFEIKWDGHNGEWIFCSDTNETGGKYKGSIVIGNIYENPELLEEKK